MKSCEERGRCRWCVAGFLWRGVGAPQEVGDVSRECSPGGRPAVATANPGKGTGGWRSRGARRVARAPSRCRCSTRRRNRDGGHQRARQWVPVVQVVFAESGGAGEGGLSRWSAMMRRGPVGGVLSEVAVEGDEVLCAARRFVVADCWAAG